MAFEPHPHVRKPKWSRDENIRLLALVDFVVSKERVGKKLQKDDVLRYMRDSMNSRKYSIKSIKSKLFHVCGQFGTLRGNEVLESLLYCGISSLKHLPKDTKFEIRDIWKVSEIVSPRNLRKRSDLVKLDSDTKPSNAFERSGKSVRRRRATRPLCTKSVKTSVPHTNARAHRQRYVLLCRYLILGHPYR